MDVDTRFHLRTTFLPQPLPTDECTVDIGSRPLLHLGISFEHPIPSPNHPLLHISLQHWQGCCNWLAVQPEKKYLGDVWDGEWFRPALSVDPEKRYCKTWWCTVYFWVLWVRSRSHWKICCVTGCGTYLMWPLSERMVLPTLEGRWESVIEETPEGKSTGLLNQNFYYEPNVCLICAFSVLILCNCRNSLQNIF